MMFLRYIFDSAFLIQQNSTHQLTHWGRVTRICVGKLTIIGSDNGLSPERHQAIIWTNAGILLIGPLGTNLIEMLNEMRLKMSSVKCCSFRLGLNVLTHCGLMKPYGDIDTDEILV